jgi:hypothetical protein
VLNYTVSTGTIMTIHEKLQVRQLTFGLSPFSFALYKSKPSSSLVDDGLLCKLLVNSICL